MENNWIKTNREALSLSQAKLAAELGVGKTTVGKWESGKAPSTQLWTRLAAFFKERGLEVPPMPDNLPKGRTRNDKRGTAPGKLREKRLAADLSLEDVARAVGVTSGGAVGHWEKGRVVPSQKAIEALAELFQCTPEDLGFPRIRNGLTVEERNDLLLSYLEDIHKAVYGMRRLMYASHTDQEDARQDAALAVLEALGRADGVEDREMLNHYIFTIIKGALLQSVRRSNNRGFTAVPYGTYPAVRSFELLMNILGSYGTDEY